MPCIDLTQLKVNAEALHKFTSIEGVEREFSFERRISPLAFDMRTLSEASLLNRDGTGGGVGGIPGFVTSGRRNQNVVA
jgi:hypothetical protein